MGYNTYFKLDRVEYDDKIKNNPESLKLEEQIRELYKKRYNKDIVLPNDIIYPISISSWEDAIDNFLGLDPSYSVWRTDTKWYEHEKDMKAFSLKHPDYIFYYSGEGEENGDIWKARVHNGKHQIRKAKIIIPEFEED